ncbi:MAG: helix-turn-helix domain-containing protein [Bacilli bacterium]|nr:helix-turn-helix domain-containing protein [Bacilli bacterium]
MNSNIEILAENLTYYRKAAGYTQLEIADKFNYSDKSISKWERGEGTPDVFVLKALADLYGIKIDDFFTKEKRSKVNKKSRHWYITGLSVGLVWLVAALVFTTCQIAIPRLFPWWLIFVYAVVASGIVCTVWAAIYKRLEYLLIAVSVIIWSACASSYLSVLLLHHMQYDFLLFLVGVPIQILAIIWYFFKRNNKKKMVKQNTPE